ncbi:BsaWI family type II restriction enzyme [Fervidobacterium sp.]
MDGRQQMVSKEGSYWETYVADVLCKDPVIREKALVASGTNSEKRKDVCSIDCSKVTKHEQKKHACSEENQSFSIPIDELKIIYEGNRTKLIDNDLIVYNKNKGKIVCVLSVKKSLRERAGQTAYWMMKKKEQRKDFKYIFVTPDVDNELRPNRKWRVILASEMDAVFVIGENETSEEYKPDGNFYVGEDKLVDYVKSLL